MNQNKVLAEANRLVSNGLRKAAIDLLREYLDTDPDSTKVLGTLGRAYLLDRQPEKAVIYLTRSLEISQRSRSVVQEKTEYRADDFNDEDMAFVEMQAAGAREETFSYDDGESVGPGIIAPHEITERLKAHPVTPQEPAEVTRAIDENSLGPGDHQLNPDDTPHCDATNPEDSDEDPNLGAVEHGPANATDWQGNLDSPRDEEDDGEEDYLYNIPLDELTFEEIFENDTGDSGDSEDDDLLLDDALIASPIPLDDEEGDFSWDDLEDLDEFDELANRAFENDDDEDAVTREQRARQIAVEVLAETDWEQIHLPLLQQIFFENGWCAARIAIEKAIGDGLTPDELSLAREIRLLWAESDQYWIAFNKIKTDAPFCQADAAYKHMSWLEAIRIVRCFPYVPDTDEVYALIKDAYEQWYNSDRLRSAFKAFFKFLKYRTGSMRRALPGDLAFSFRESTGADIGVDSDVLLSALTPERQELARLGIRLDRWPTPPEYNIKIIKAHLEHDQ